MTTASEPVYVTSGLVRLTRPQLIGTMTGLLLAALLAAIDQTIVGTAEPRIIASLSGFDRYPWVATIYLLTSTVSVPIFASLSDVYGRKPFFMIGATLFVVDVGAVRRGRRSCTFMPIDGMGQLICFAACRASAPAWSSACSSRSSATSSRRPSAAGIRGCSRRCGAWRRSSGRRSAAG